MENSVDYMDTDNTCIRCASDLSEGMCGSCGFSPSEGQKCPSCGFDDLYDAEVVYCYNCGYNGLEAAYEPIVKADGPPTCLFCGEREEPYHFCEPMPSNAGEELLPAVDLVESYEIARKTDNILGLNWRHFAPYKPEPYQPFFDLIEDLKKWKVTVRKTDDRGGLHTWVNKLASKGAGCDTTHMGKAFGPYVWIPESQWGTKQGYCTLVHEATHAKDFWKFGTIFFFLMQNLLPFGPSFVALFEYRAYVAGLKAEKKAYGYLLPKATENVANALASRGYRYCFPFPKLMKKLLDKAIGD
jgi:hypothetical protein